MAISPWYAGAQSPAWTLTLQVANPNPQLPPLPVPGLVNNQTTGFGLAFRSNYLSSGDPNFSRAGTGTFLVTDAANGVVTYQPSAADVALPGDYTLIVTYTPTNNQPYKWETHWVCLP